mmetsp:Transcript_13829/g.26853  ORF Transcript_13829/g.26853 Transcript_13829/m.26853 type:complete len:82 (+) Transcript_13829:176-421(+)
MADAHTLSEDWKNREVVESLEVSVLQITQFLHRFDGHVRNKLAELNHRIDAVGKSVSVLEESISLVPSTQSPHEFVSSQAA